MKRFILKTLNIILTIILVISVLYSMFNLVMGFLPSEIQKQVYGWLHMSSEYIATFSISAVINSAVLVATKIAQTQSRIRLNARLYDNEQVVKNDIAVNKTVIDRENEIITRQNLIIALINSLLSVQKVTTERNIKASDKLVYKSEKEAYIQALEQINAVQEQLKEIDNITTVYEKTEVKEIIVEKEDDTLSGRV